MTGIETIADVSLQDLRETVYLLHAAGAAVATRFLTAFDTLHRQDAAELGATFYAECVKKLARERGTEDVLRRTVAALCNGKAVNTESTEKAEQTVEGKATADERR